MSPESAPAPGPPSTSTALRNGLLIAVALVISGCTSTAAKVALRELPPFTTVVLRYLVMTLLLQATLPLVRRWEDAARVPIARADYWRVLLAAVVWVPVSQSLFLNGVRLGTAAHSGLLSALGPLFIYLLTCVTGQAKPTLRLSAAMIIGFVGAASISWESAMHADSGAALVWVGDLLILASVLVWSNYSVHTLPLSRRYGPVRFLTLVTTIGTTLALPLLWIDAYSLRPESLSPRAILGFSFIAVLTGYLLSMIWFVGSTRMSINHFALTLSASPILSVLVAHFVDAEPLTHGLYLGGSMIVAAIVLAHLDKLLKLPGRNGNSLPAAR